MAKDGQAVAEMLKAKIENEEGFFEFRMLKVEPYSKYIHNSHHNITTVFPQTLPSRNQLLKA